MYPPRLCPAFLLFLPHTSSSRAQLVDGITYLFVKKNGLFFVLTTKFNVSPSFSVELLERMTRVFKDYCGVLTEESIRKNFILLYELLDEMIVRRVAGGAHAHAAFAVAVVVDPHVLLHRTTASHKEQRRST